MKKKLKMQIDADSSLLLEFDDGELVFFSI